MSSKKQITKKKTVPEKKSSAKKASPAKKAQPAKSVKSVAQKKPATSAKPVSAKKPAAKTKAAPGKKSAPTKVQKKVTPAKATAKKEEPKKKLVLAKKQQTAKNLSPKAPAAKKNPSPKTLGKVSKTPKPASTGSKDTPNKKGRELGNPVIEEPKKTSVPEPKLESPVSKPKQAEVLVEKDDSVLIALGGKLGKTCFFSEDDEQEDRAPKKKTSGPESVEKPTACMRHRASLAEETPEELYARVVQELQEENLRLTKECSNQLCTKCCRNPVAPEFRVDKDLGYCEECAEILGLGRSKEARHLNYQAKLLGMDSLDEARDDDFGEAPSQQEIEEADKDLDLDDDSDIG